MDGRSLREYKDGSTEVTYTYNLDGIRRTKTVNGKQIDYYLNGMNIVFEDRAGSVLYYIYNEDEVLGFVYDGVTYYYHKNILGDVIGILDSNYQEIVTYSYDAYGNILSITDNSINNIGEINPFRYRSYYYDIETNLYYLNSRYYNPETGRFLNADGIISSNEDIISSNLFQYASNNFINNVDISGNSIISSIKKAIKAVGDSVYYASNEVKKRTGLLGNVAINGLQNFGKSASMFARSIFRVKNDKQADLSSSDKDVLIRAVKSNSMFNSQIASAVNTANENGIRHINENYDVTESSGNFAFKAIVGRFSYNLMGSRNSDGNWDLRVVIINEKYDFTEVMPFTSIFGFANNTALGWQQQGFVKPYYWTLVFDIKYPEE